MVNTEQQKSDAVLFLTDILGPGKLFHDYKRAGDVLAKINVLLVSAAADTKLTSRLQNLSSQLSKNLGRCFSSVVYLSKGLYDESTAKNLTPALKDLVYNSDDDMIQGVLQKFVDSSTNGTVEPLTHKLTDIKEFLLTGLGIRVELTNNFENLKKILTASFK
jgi:hypothetical protein